MKMRFKFITHVTLMLTTTLLLLTTTTFAANTSHQQSLDKIAAIVDNSVITESELNQALENAKRQIQAANLPMPNESTLRKQVLDQLINRKLQLQLADQLNIHVTDADVNRTINNIAKANNVPVSELYKKIAEEGISLANYRKELREEMTLQQVQQQEVGSKIAITHDEVKNFMHSKSAPNSAATGTEYKVADTLVALSESPSATEIAKAQKQANELLAKLRQGSKTHDAANTTDLGWRKLSEMPSAFAQFVAQMKKNEFAGPIQTGNGFHLLHLLDVRGMSDDAASTALSEKQAEQALYQKKMEEELKPWITKLRSGAYINTHPDNS